jgi:C1A family cysteine protease
VPVNHVYGWVPNTFDARDHVYRDVFKIASRLPVSVSLRPQSAPVWNQGNLGSCTWQGTGAQLALLHVQQGLHAYIPSVLFGYWNTRNLEGTVNVDAGGQIRDAIKVAASLGCCTEACWPYVIEKFADRPPVGAFTEARKHVAIQYQVLAQTSAELRGALANGHGIVFGMQLYSSFESGQVARTGQVPMPKYGEPYVGGHCMQIIGYDDRKQRFEVRNSWGADWGDGGYCWIPYNVMLNPKLCSDFTTIQKAT